MSVKEILKSKRNPKEKVSLLAEKLNQDRTLVSQLIECFKEGTIGEKGNCLEAMQYASKGEPDIALPYVDFLIERLDDMGPRIKWEAAETIQNVAQRFPQEVSKAVPKLFEKVDDASTVVRWSVASALAEVSKNNPGMQKKLIPKFQEILTREENNGVRKVYIRHWNHWGKRAFENLVELQYTRSVLGVKLLKAETT